MQNFFHEFISDEEGSPVQLKLLGATVSSSQRTTPVSLEAMKLA